MPKVKISKGKRRLRLKTSAHLWKRYPSRHADISLLIAPPMSALDENVPIEKTVNFRFANDVQSAYEIEVSYFVGPQTDIDGCLHLSPHWKSLEPPATSNVPSALRMKTAD
jgi:hypothetical protein